MFYPIISFQLQSNYAGDFRSILRCVFVLNATQDEPDSVDGGDIVDAGGVSNDQNALAVAAEADLPSPTEQVKMISIQLVLKTKLCPQIIFVLSFTFFLLYLYQQTAEKILNCLSDTVGI